jgi:hypothetical protein
VMILISTRVWAETVLKESNTEVRIQYSAVKPADRVIPLKELKEQRKAKTAVIRNIDAYLETIKAKKAIDIAERDVLDEMIVNATNLGVVDEVVNEEIVNGELNP